LDWPHIFLYASPEFVALLTLDHHKHTITIATIVTITTSSISSISSTRATSSTAIHIRTTRQRVHI
jgi:hypothetical protein